MTSVFRYARRYARPVGLGLVLAGLMTTAYIFLVMAPAVQTFGFDAWAYWNVSMPTPYDKPVGAIGSFNYSPPIAWLFSWFSTVDWWVFLWLWTALLVGTVIWMGWTPLGIAIAFALPFVATEIYHGNIHILLAAAVVLGFRHPWTWTFVLLTKPTVAVGLLWFVVRREWRELAVAVVPAVAIVLVTLLLAPNLWADWLAYIRTDFDLDVGLTAIRVPLWIRLAIGAVVVVWGALTDRRWTVIVGSALALPVLWIAGLAMLLGLLPEWRAHVPRRWPDGRCCFVLVVLSVGGRAWLPALATWLDEDVARRGRGSTRTWLDAPVRARASATGEGAPFRPSGPAVMHPGGIPSTHVPARPV